MTESKMPAKINTVWHRLLYKDVYHIQMFGESNDLGIDSDNFYQSRYRNTSTKPTSQ